MSAVRNPRAVRWRRRRWWHHTGTSRCAAPTPVVGILRAHEQERRAAASLWRLSAYEAPARVLATGGKAGKAPLRHCRGGGARNHPLLPRCVTREPSIADMITSTESYPYGFLSRVWTWRICRRRSDQVVTPPAAFEQQAHSLPVSRWISWRTMARSDHTSSPVMTSATRSTTVMSSDPSSETRSSSSRLI